MTPDDSCFASSPLEASSSTSKSSPPPSFSNSSSSAACFRASLTTNLAKPPRAVNIVAEEMPNATLSCMLRRTSSSPVMPSGWPAKKEEWLPWPTEPDLEPIPKSANGMASANEAETLAALDLRPRSASGDASGRNAAWPCTFNLVAGSDVNAGSAGAAGHMASEANAERTSVPRLTRKLDGAVPERNAEYSDAPEPAPGPVGPAPSGVTVCVPSSVDNGKPVSTPE
mmetsp:Transcript_97805/g.276664  ORF Transcript_97805/g.276664 Transcript_97805/m.276664 type:complete len:227 (-) Transcript_97805:335-1015(-)